MAFTANLAVALWAVLLRRFQAQWIEFSDAAEAFARSELIQEELSIRRLRQTIASWRKAVDVLRAVGLGTGLALALFLYVMRLHGDSICLAWLCSRTALLFAAYTSPLLMTAMTLVGLEGKRRAGKQVADLQDLVAKKEQQGDELFERLIARI